MSSRSMKRVLKQALQLVFLMMMLVPSASLASGTMSGMGMQMMSASPATQRESFIDLWPKAFKLAAFSESQVKRLTSDLENLNRTLSTNTGELAALKMQREKAPGSEAGNLERRIALKETERDLLLSKAETALKEYLSKQQVELVVTAAFHGVSPGYGDDHKKNTHGSMGSMLSEFDKMCETLGELAEKLNQGGHTVTLGIILDLLKKAP